MNLVEEVVQNDTTKACAMALAACRIFVEEHNQTYDGEPMSMEIFRALEYAKKAITLMEKEQSC